MLPQAPRTPLPQKAPKFLSSSDTPFSIKKVFTAEADLCTEAARRLVLEDLQETVPTVPVTCFTDPDGLLPDLRPEIDLNEVIESLTKRNVLYPSNSRWANFGHTRDLQGHEDDVFAILPKIMEKIIDASGINSSEATVTFECNPKGLLESHTRDNNSKPDCVGRISSSKTRYDQREWIDVAIPGEFKKKNTDENLQDDATKVIWSMTHIMREDVRRRFVFGFTIEKWDMRIWLVSRSDVLVSWKFNINTHPQRFIQFVLRIAFAEPHQLGWDETITRIPGAPSMPVQYEIDVNGKKYKTVRLLSNVGAEALRGRGTRVWEVRELSEDGLELPRPLVLKDCWIDSTRAKEGEILKEIREAAQKKKCLETIDMCLLTTVDYGNVLVRGVEDNTFKVIRRGRDIDESKRFPLEVKADPIAHKKIVSSRPPVGGPSVPRKKPDSHLRYSEKIHHRVIFAEVGERITNINSLAKVFEYLAQTVIGLEALHECRWVHRDISIGNILVANGIAMLADVEYAKSEDASAQHGMRTGTAYFMSPEVEVQTYLYRKVEDVVPNDISDDLEKAAREKRRGFLAAKKLAQGKNVPNADYSTTSRPVPPSVVPPPPSEADASATVKVNFRHNPLHDLDSVLWVSFWETICSDFVKNDPNMTQEEWDNYMVEHGNFAAELFCNAHFREHVMTLESDFFLSHIGKLLPQVQEILHMLDEFRSLLATRYRLKERSLGTKGYNLGFDVADGLHGPIFEILMKISATLEANDLHINVKDQDSVPVKLVKQAMQDRATQDVPPRASTSNIRSSAVAGGQSSTRPAKSQKTRAARSAGMSSAPSLRAPSTRQTRSRTASSSKPRGSTSRSYRG